MVSRIGARPLSDKNHQQLTYLEALMPRYQRWDHELWY